MKLNKAIMGQLVKLHRETDLGTRLSVYDGKKNLYTAGLLPFTTKEFKVTLVDECEGFESTKYDSFLFITVLHLLRLVLLKSSNLTMFVSGGMNSR